MRKREFVFSVFIKTEKGVWYDKKDEKKIIKIKEKKRAGVFNIG